jgi:4-aminobutyrate aminotransferase-like enzyme
MRARNVLDLLRRFESRNVTFLDSDGSWPIVWDRAQGVHVWDAEGRRYLDLTAAFGVAAAGHANPRVVRAGQLQMVRLLHAMGDVHPHALKAELARELSRLTFERWSRRAPASKTPQSGLDPGFRVERSAELQFGTPPVSSLPSPVGRSGRPSAVTGKTIFCNSGFEAVEAALKTALLATGKRGVIAFQGAYHGLGYGALNVTHREMFAEPFRSQLGRFGHFVSFPAAGPDLVGVERTIRQIFRRHAIGALLVEPVQGRGGINVPPPEFLPLLRRLCDAHRALLVVDEIYTGFGRTGRWFACEHSVTLPDLICVGKALAGGFPISACVGRADLMDAAWPTSAGEAIHTSTFLGHPVGCAMALAQVAEIRRRGLVERSARLGRYLLQGLQELSGAGAAGTREPRGLGLMAGLELRTQAGRPDTEKALQAVKAMLSRGFILLPEGEPANVIGFTPPLTINRRDLGRALTALGEILA